MLGLIIAFVLGAVIGPVAWKAFSPALGALIAKLNKKAGAPTDPTSGS